jgi:hypothetical protein
MSDEGSWFVAVMIIVAAWFVAVISIVAEVVSRSAPAQRPKPSPDLTPATRA